MLRTRLSPFRIAFDKNRSHAHPAPELDIRKRVADHHALLWANFAEFPLRLLKHARQRFAAVALLLVVRTKVERIDMRAMSIQDLLQLTVDRFNISNRVFPERNASLIRDHNHPHSRAVQSCDRFCHARQQAELLPCCNVTSLRHLFVHNAIAVQKDRAKVAFQCTVWVVGHPVMIATTIRTPRLLSSLCRVVRKGAAVIGQLHQVIQEIEHQWAGKRLLVVGDVMLDKYIWGDVGRISPEAPVPVVRGTRQEAKPGGAANVAMNLAGLGAQAAVVGITGGDEDEKLLAAALTAAAIEPCLVPSAEFSTITKTRILGGSQQMLRLDFERLGKIEPAAHKRLVDAGLAQLASCDALVLSDYAKGALKPNVCQALIQAARKRGIPILVDPKSPDYSRYRGATTICPNLGDLAAATQLGAGNLEPLLAAAEAMVTDLDIEFFTATMSEKGIALIRPGNRFVAPAQARQVFDVSGAGDTVIAVLALCLASALQPETAVQLANVAAGIVVGKVGTVPVEKHELLAALSPQIALQAANQVLTREELVERVRLWKANGERVVFTNGCFDLLHIGHITLLEQARRFGDRLIVAINSDASVSALKGPTRPIVSQTERARVLAALAAVDAVVVFDEPTPLELIVAARPDVLVKGGDYQADSIVGAKEIASWGGDVRIVPLVEGFSTTRLIEKGAGR